MLIIMLPVTDLRPGDVITTDSDDITVDAISPVHIDGPMIRIHGRITRGTGRSNRERIWTRHADQLVDVERHVEGL